MSDTRADLDKKLMYGESFKIPNKVFFSNYYTLHRSDLAARAAPLDPRLYEYYQSLIIKYGEKNIPSESLRIPHSSH